MEEYQDSGAAERRYLLGELAEDEQRRFEEELMSGSRSFEELLAAEDELVDQYVARTLDERERRRFEQYFLATPERRRKLGFARTLRRYVADAGLTATAVEGETRGLSSAPPSSSSPATGEESAEGEAPADDAPAGDAATTPAPADRPRPAPVWARLLASSPRSRAVTAFGLLLVFSVGALLLFNTLRGPRTGGQTLALTLAPGAVRASDGGVKQLRLTPEAGAVELRLQTRADAHRRYRADILTVEEDRPVFSTPEEIEPTADGPAALVNVRVPASRLAPGDYKLNLTGATPGGTFEDIDTYYFRVTR